MARGSNSKRSATVTARRELLDLDEAARISSFTRARLEEDIRDGDLRAVRRTGRLYVSAAVLRAYVRYHRQVARDIVKSEEDVRAGRISGPFRSLEEFHANRRGGRRRAR